MYNIKCCRIGHFYTLNEKGVFILKFKTLSELAKFVYDEGFKNLYYPELGKVLSKKELYIFRNKFDALVRKNQK